MGIEVAASVVLVCAGVAALVVLRSIPAIATAARETLDAQQVLAHASSTWDAQGLDAIQSIVVDLSNAQMTLTRAAERLESQAFLRYVPVARNAHAAAVNAARGAEAWVRGAHRLATIGADVQRVAEQFGSRTFASLTAAEQAELVQIFGSAVLRLRNADAAFAVGDEALARAQCSRRVRALVPQCAALDRALGSAAMAEQRQRLRGMTRTAAAFANAAGDTKPTDILVMFLNNTELRPGGGFFGTYGLARIAGGALRSFTTDDVYALDKEVVGILRRDPPAPFRQRGIVQYWYLRDANWSPDFAESSKTVLDFYAAERGPGQPKVVIGFTPTLAAAFLALTGPVTVEGVRFDAANIADELEYQVEKAYYDRGIPQERRKDIIAPLSRAVVARFAEVPLREAVRIASIVRTAVEERQLMAYSTDPLFQGAFEQVGAAGHVAPLTAGDDALLVVDANLGALKTDSVMERATTYALRPDARGGFIGTVTLTYRNTGTFTWKTTRYQSYTRVYMPPGTVLYGVRGAAQPPDLAEELGRAVFGAYWTIEPGATGTLTFDIGITPAVAAQIRDGRYALHAQKQLGLPRPTQLTVDHQFGISVEKASPAEVPAAWGDGRYTITTDLQLDRQFAVELQRVP